MAEKTKVEEKKKNPNYPKMLYKFPGTQYKLDGGMFDVMQVADAKEEAAALKNGWFVTSTEALKAVEGK